MHFLSNIESEEAQRDLSNEFPLLNLCRILKKLQYIIQVISNYISMILLWNKATGNIKNFRTFLSLMK